MNKKLIETLSSVEILQVVVLLAVLIQEAGVLMWQSQQFHRRVSFNEHR